MWWGIVMERCWPSDREIGGSGATWEGEWTGVGANIDVVSSVGYVVDLASLNGSCRICGSLPPDLLGGAPLVFSC